MLHAVDHARVIADDEGNKALYLGPDRAGNMLEIITVPFRSGNETIIHAMRIRPIHEPLLRGLEE